MRMPMLAGLVCIACTVVSFNALAVPLYSRSAVDADAKYYGQIPKFGYVAHSIGAVKLQYQVRNTGDADQADQINWPDKAVSLDYRSFDYDTAAKKWVVRDGAAGTDSIEALKKEDTTVVKNSSGVFKTRWSKPDAWTAALTKTGKRIYTPQVDPAKPDPLRTDQAAIDRTGHKLTAKFNVGVPGFSLNVEYKGAPGAEKAEVPKPKTQRGVQIGIGIQSIFGGEDPLYHIAPIVADAAVDTGLGVFEGIDLEFLYDVTGYKQIDYVVQPRDLLPVPRTNPLLGAVAMDFSFPQGQFIFAGAGEYGPENLFHINIPYNAPLGVYLFALNLTPEVVAPGQFPGHVPGLEGTETVWGSFQVVSEPSTLLLFALAVGGILVTRRISGPRSNCSAS